MLPPACISEQREANPLPKVYADEKDQEGFKAAFEKIWGPMEEIEKLHSAAQLDEFYRTQISEPHRGALSRTLQTDRTANGSENADEAAERPRASQRVRWPWALV